MASYCLILLSFFLLLFLLPIYVQTSPFGAKLARLQNERSILWESADSKTNDMKVQMHGNDLPQSPDTPKTTDSISQRGHPFLHHRQRHLQNVYGILILIGWGSLLLIGVIVARYCGKFPLQCEEWYSFHTVCQTVGYILGTVGWCLGMWLTTSSKQCASKTQRTLTTIAFTFLNVQMLSIFIMRPRKENCFKWWSIWHKVLGYAIVAIIIANIVEGINNRSQGGILRWVHVCILAVLALTAASLEIFRCIKSSMLKHYAIQQQHV